MPVIYDTPRLLLIIFFFLPTILPSQDIITVTDSDLQAGDYTWTANNTYLLTERVFLEAGGRLTIEAGTVVKAAANVPAGQSTIGLTILPGAEFFALGTAEAPIIFTAEQDNLSGSIDPVADENFRGLWSGLVVMGMPEFNSGRLSYLSIRYAGVDIKGEDNPALAFWMVDRQTQLDHLEVHASASDGVGIYGGTAFLRNIVVSYTSKDAFNWDYGWTGTGIYWFSFVNRLAVDGAGNSLDDQNIYAQPEIHNGTFLLSDLGLSFNSNSAGTIANSLMADFVLEGAGLDIEDQGSDEDSRTQLVNGNLNILNNIWWRVPRGNTEIAQVSTRPEDDLIVNHLIKNYNIASTIGLRAYGCDESPIFDPRLRSAILLESGPNAPYPDLLLPFRPDDDRKGAFVTEQIWINDWTALSQVGKIGDAATPKLRFKDLIFAPGDTIDLDCRDMPFLQDSLSKIDPCGIIIFPDGIRSSASRRGNRKRPSSARDQFGDPEVPAFVEEWILADIFDYQVATALLDTFRFTVNIFDSTPPIIHLIPNEQGQLRPYLEDCDEAWITKDSVATETIGGTTFVHHYYEAIDYSGNTSSLSFTERVGQTLFLYPDLDRDGYGRPEFNYRSGSMLPGFVDNPFDCNDDNALVYPNSFPITGFDCNDLAQNDDCFNAIELTAGDCPTFEHFNLYGSSPTIFPALPTDCRFPNNYRDVWFKVRVPNSGKLNIDLEISTIPGAPAAGFYIELYNGSCQDLSLLDCFSVDKLDVEMTDLAPGTFIYLRIMEAANLQYIDFLLCVSQEEPIPNITGDQPVEQPPYELPNLDNGNKYPRLFPNPVHKTGFLSFDLSPLETLPESIRILNPNGRVVLDIPLEQASPILRIDLSEKSLAPGIHFVQWQFPDEILTRKLIIID